jgi:hypothetical protein
MASIAVLVLGCGVESEATLESDSGAISAGACMKVVIEEIRDFGISNHKPRVCLAPDGMLLPTHYKVPGVSKWMLAEKADGYVQYAVWSKNPPPYIRRNPGEEGPALVARFGIRQEPWSKGYLQVFFDTPETLSQVMATVPPSLAELLRTSEKIETHTDNLQAGSDPRMMSFWDGMFDVSWMRTFGLGWLASGLGLEAGKDGESLMVGADEVCQAAGFASLKKLTERTLATGVQIVDNQIALPQWMTAWFTLFQCQNLRDMSLAAPRELESPQDSEFVLVVDHNGAPCTQNECLVTVGEAARADAIGAGYGPAFRPTPADQGFMWQPMAAGTGLEAAVRGQYPCN